MIYLCNGLSESMKHDPNMKQIPYPLSEREFCELIHRIEFESVIGHKELAEYLTELTKLEIPFNRRAIKVSYDDMILLVSMNGRLPEHPSKVDYNGRLNYTLVRFVKQSQEDFLMSMSVINEIKAAI